MVENGDTSSLPANEDASRLENIGNGKSLVTASTSNNDETKMYLDDDPSKRLNLDGDYSKVDATLDHKKDDSSFRSSLGQATTTVMDWANENKIAVRYGVVATITLLGAYGMAHSPLLFRYHSVSELSKRQFQNQATLHARVVRIVDMKNNAPEQPIRLEVRHLAPLERILSESAYDMLRKYHPRNNLGGGRGSGNSKTRNTGYDLGHDKLLTVELMGVTHPPEYYSTLESHGDWLENLLAQTQTKVRIKLVARRTFPDNSQTPPKVHNVFRQPARDKKREIPNFPVVTNEQETEAASTTRQPRSKKNQVAIAHVFFRPKHPKLRSKSSSWWPYTWPSLGPTNLAYDLVRHGRASASDELWYRSDSQGVEGHVCDTAEQLHPRDSIRFLESLQEAQRDAASERRGMWADSHVQETYKDVVQEADFQVQAPWYQKLWRRIRDRV